MCKELPTAPSAPPRPRRAVARLMRLTGLKGATRGKAVRITISGRAAA